MKVTTTLTLALIAAPMSLFAQQASATAAASSQTTVSLPVTYSVESKATIEAAFKRARDRNLPDRTMRDRIAEGQAKAASDAQVAASVQKAESHLEASQSALVKAGRTNPAPDEVTNGAQAMERGATEAQVMAVVMNPPATVSIAAALDGLARVAGTPGAAGVSVTGAVQGTVNGVLPKKP